MGTYERGTARLHGARSAAVADRAALGAALAAALALGSLPAVLHAQSPASPAAVAAAVRFDITAGPMERALTQFSEQSGIQILYEPHLVTGLQATAFSGVEAPMLALQRLLGSAGLSWTRINDNTVTLQRIAGARQGGIEEVIVTGQKREERIQDVPIAISAFSMDELSAMKIEGGSELLRAIPNVSFSKANFSMYNFSIRGVGTKAVSASSDPAVAVSFNGTPLIRNRLFEQEYLDVERIEVLRGPQGTLYGRNATGGVVNMIPRLPDSEFDGFIKAEAGNYGSRRMAGMINVPMGSRFGMRMAAAMTQRDGFDYNSFNETRVNDRDLWAGRLSAQLTPTDRMRFNLIWEHFEEDDRRSRTGKQLCTRDEGLAQVGNTAVPTAFLQARLSQGCRAASLFHDDAYGVPNGASLGHVVMAGSIYYGHSAITGEGVNAVDFGVDPYQGLSQSRDLRTIATSYDPIFQVENDVVQFNAEFELSDGLTLVSQTAYARDLYYSTQDYNRFVSNPIINDSHHPMRVPGSGELMPQSAAAPGGFYHDPQLGPSNRMVSADLSQSDNRQWSQELRLQSSFDGAFNFSVGANYLDFQSEDNYYVFNNLFTLIAEYWYNEDPSLYMTHGRSTQICDENVASWKECVYVDPTPMHQLAGDGHNYFRSRNVVGIRSWAVFGEGYFDLRDDLRLTAGLRYTNDRKVSTPYPSQLLLGANGDGSPGLASGGYVSRGYPAMPDVRQSWNAVTGRLVLDWKPVLSFTDDTLIYASYARGYKGGGTNPPRVDINPIVIQYQPLAEDFAPEYVNAFEIGTKNILLDGMLRLNATAFLYDYKDYQVSQIVDRISLNENFDATIWGVELEATLRPTDALQIDAMVGYLKTRIGGGQGSIDVMDRTQGNEDWVVLRPWIQVPSNCIAPARHVETILNSGMDENSMMFGMQALCSGSVRYGSFNPDFNTMLPMWAFFGFEYDGITEAPNGGRGFAADLGGNELPNAPNWTASIGAQYTFFIREWELTLRGDHYWQDKSYARVYNTEYDRLKAWDNSNFSITFANPGERLSFQLYVKNAFDKTPITDVFTNSDDTGLTANVFTLDPRLIGFSITKGF